MWVPLPGWETLGGGGDGLEAAPRASSILQKPPQRRVWSDGHFAFRSVLATKHAPSETLCPEKGSAKGSAKRQSETLTNRRDTGLEAAARRGRVTAVREDRRIPRDGSLSATPPEPGPEHSTATAEAERGEGECTGKAEGKEDRVSAASLQGEQRSLPRLGLSSCVVKTYHKLDEEIFVPFSSWPMKRRQVIQRVVEFHRRIRHPHVAQLLAVGLMRSPDRSPSSTVEATPLSPAERSEERRPRTVSSPDSHSSSSSLCDWPFASVSLVLQDGGVPLAQKLRDLPSRPAKAQTDSHGSQGLSSAIGGNGEGSETRTLPSTSPFPPPPASGDASMVYCVPVRDVRTAENTRGAHAMVAAKRRLLVSVGEASGASSVAGECKAPREGSTYVLLEATAREVLRQLVSAVRALHAERIFHLDIKPGNVVVAEPFAPALVRRVSLHPTVAWGSKPLESAQRPEGHRQRDSNTRQGSDLRVVARDETLANLAEKPSVGGGRTGRNHQASRDSDAGKNTDADDGSDTEDASGSSDATERRREPALYRQERRVKETGAPRIRCLLVDFDSAQSGVKGTACVHPGGTSRVFIPPEEFCPLPSAPDSEACGGPSAASEQETTGQTTRPFLNACLLGLGSLDSSEAFLDGEKKDVWALGCLLAILLTGRHPFLRPAGWSDGWCAPSGAGLTLPATQNKSGNAQVGRELTPTGGERPRTNECRDETPRESDEGARLRREGRPDEGVSSRQPPPTADEDAGTVFSSDMEYCLALIGGAAPRMGFRGLPKLSREAKDILRGMLAASPDRRLSLEGVMAHPWFRGPTEQQARFGSQAH
ncbi:Atypical MEK-related kinase (incomplete catalytic triad) [Neospora caninum Liverpool]|uniref:Atypical MEK-related kinase (Incomplete catalytic triad) n=1 Tax=Neospora caninum (strain Liverpool) TaxID=572307 RepID=F0VGQ5_NEOCL|nr:Atypical MEK-related kinase (incomplete catalytic triad) [Neospora caninum Liverpool]CBZ52899.1 Atypical MEK-related kinase (incomplete catalytic triad) [Neospora caninum Liverpool]|eukprot:XP_003882931.1 Atypical MEK-related kinase (incomplete catalytic triad) [Neospora caninum Liverpool]